MQIKEGGGIILSITRNNIVNNNTNLREETYMSNIYSHMIRIETVVCMSLRFYT